ncbi:MerR family transcriptional regulator [Mycolicibacterium hodleri]|uniref:MerR family transcriptional regulator n=1 Tax=Mycolicibacterium hodleri TaxID=49897 RepID=A0A502E6F2_9MYCO|nr:MerR family transcriptional regulator [Mycolicibacterium hodleri]TPG33067.1 MerR family transcriptional regulator [Mycolicibacterium hodleri]
MTEYRLDELAVLSGISVRNIRAYRERGLLDPPRREGRSAYYGDCHLSQLRTINELLRKGFTSAHIAEFLASARQGGDVGVILGLQQPVFGPSRRPAAVPVDIDADGDEAERLLRYGLAEMVDGRVTLVNPQIAEVVAATTEQAPYVETILRVADGIADLLDELAKSVADSLETSLFVRFGENKVPPPDHEDELRRLSTDYRALGRRVVVDQLEDALHRHLVAVASDDATDGMRGGQPHSEDC